ncbi:hypothetical protein BY458DRAFT_527360 [Sporodiniella umbellata]|nr:hypothetical protein BY458DRAFT_527360 [Sporodiniella umbellata]
MYSPDQYEILAEVNSVACITFVSLIFGRKLASIDGPVDYVKGLLLSLYGLCWAFNLIACMLTSTNNGNLISCAMTQFNIALVAAAAKITLFLYLTEKVYIVSVPKTSRMQNHLYLLSLLLLMPLVGVIVVQIAFRVNVVAPDYPFHCSVGLELPAALACLAYDAFLVALYAGIFIKFYFFPNTVQQTVHQSSSLHMMAKRYAVVSVVVLIALCANYIILLCLQGAERGLVASSCTAIALTVICVAIHWATAHPAENQLNEKALQRTNVDKPYKLEIKQHQEVVVLTEFSRA